MKTITIVGLGPGPVAQLTKEAEAALLAAEKVSSALARIRFTPG
jgi:precorrin-6B methylase 1